MDIPDLQGNRPAPGYPQAIVTSARGWERRWMSRRPTVPSALRGITFRGSLAVKEGLITRGQLGSSAWRRLFRDVYAERYAEIDHAGMCTAAVEHLLPDAVVTGASAAFLFGIALVRRADPVELLTAAPHSPVRGLLLHNGPVDAADVVIASGLRTATPLRACWDLVRHRTPADAMCFIDQFLRKELVTVAELEKYGWAHQGEPGCRRMIEAARLADSGAESPQESRSRVLFMQAGVPKPVTQHIITDRGRFVARADMAWPDYQVAMEYEGFAYHSSRQDLARDRARLNRQAVAGWLVIHVTADRLHRDLAGVVEEVLAALRSRGWPGPPNF